MRVHPPLDRLQVETQLIFFWGKNNFLIFLKLIILKQRKLQIPSFCSTSSVCGAHGELWSTEFTFCSVPFGDTGSRLTCTEESVLEGVLPEDWNGDGVFMGTQAPCGGTEDKVSKKGRREPEGIESAAI